MEDRADFDSEMAVIVADELHYYADRFQKQAMQMTGCRKLEVILDHMRTLEYYHGMMVKKILTMERLTKGLGI